MQPRALLALIASALLASCGGGIERDAVPAVWMVRDSDTVIYIAGTIHMLPEGLDWRNGPIVDAIAQSGELVTELSPAELAEAQRIAPAYFYGIKSEPPTQRFVPELQAEYRRIAASNLPRQFDRDRLDDWALALLMAQTVAVQAALDGDNGMDNALIDEFSAAGRPLSGIERAAEQFAQFDAIPASEQRTMLNRLMREIAAGRAKDRLLETVDAWARGDVEALAATVARDAALAPAAHRLLLTDRNRRWADWTQRRMQRPGTLLLAVGAGHLAGPDSLLAMLDARGITPQRLR